MNVFNKSTYLLLHLIENSTSASHIPSEYPGSNFSSIINNPLSNVYLFIGTSGFSCNLFVIIILALHKQSRRNLSNLYIFSQCCVDLISSILLFLTTIFTNPGGPYSPDSVLDNLLCKLWFSKTCLWTMMVSSNYMVVALTVERYIALVYPIFHRNKFSKKKSYSIPIIGLALMAGFYEMTCTVNTSGILEDGRCHVVTIWPSNKVATSVGILTVVVEYFVPLLSIIVFYSRIAWTLHRKVAPIKDETKIYNITSNQVSDNNIMATSNVLPSNEEMRFNKQSVRSKVPKAKPKINSLANARDNVLKTSIWIAASFIGCWTMNQCYYFLYNLGFQVVDFNHPFYHTTVVMVMLQCCFNPIIYCAKLDSFHKGMRQLILNKLTKRFC